MRKKSVCDLRWPSAPILSADPLTSEYGTYKTVKTRLWRSLWGKKSFQRFKLSPLRLWRGFFFNGSELKPLVRIRQLPPFSDSGGHFKTVDHLKSTVDSHPENSPDVSKPRPVIRAKRTRVAATWLGAIGSGQFDWLRQFDQLGRLTNWSVWLVGHILLSHLDTLSTGVSGWGLRFRTSCLGLRVEGLGFRV